MFAVANQSICDSSHYFKMAPLLAKSFFFAQAYGHDVIRLTNDEEREKNNFRIFCFANDLSMRPERIVHFMANSKES